MPRLGQFGFHLNRGSWRIYQVTSVFPVAGSLSGYGMTELEHESIYPIEEREKARKRVYELNGWNYRPPK